MKITFSDLWRPNGTVNRGEYVIVGMIGFAIKHNLDRVIATYGFHRPWGLFSYWEPIKNAGRITSLHPDEARFLATLVATALPFVWVGVMMTLKRLRSMGAPAAFVILFFVPFVNLLFFLFLSLCPSQANTQPEVAEANQPWLVRIAPDGPLGSAVAAILVTAILGLAITVLSTLLLVTYGWGLFVALPFTMGLAAAAIHGIKHPRSLPACLSVAGLSVGLLGAP